MTLLCRPIGMESMRGNRDLTDTAHKQKVFQFSHEDLSRIYLLSALGKFRHLIPIYKKANLTFFDQY